MEQFKYKWLQALEQYKAGSDAETQTISKLKGREKEMKNTVSEMHSRECPILHTAVQASERWQLISPG